MYIAGIKSTHDGAIALINDGDLQYSIENEKDSQARSSTLNARVLLNTLRYADRIPDVFAVSGWGKRVSLSGHVDYIGGYCGLEHGKCEHVKVLGTNSRWYFSSHERSHLFGVYGMSPFPQGEPCYILLWEGTIGRFYHVDQDLHITGFPTVVSHPGQRYAHGYFLGSSEPYPTTSMPGKLMALAGCQRIGPLSESERLLITQLLDGTFGDSYVGSIAHLLPRREELKQIPWVNGGLTSDAFRSFAYHLSDKLFQSFYQFAKASLRERLPLLVTGGCGLNCDWNSRWKDSGLFSEVFIPPCCNDSGSALGTAVDAQYYFTGKAKIRWNVYAGEEFCDDAPTPHTWGEFELNLDRVASILYSGELVAWVNGRYEIGPRALGNRSLLGAPFLRATTDKINRIKMREWYRPVAPICLEEDVSQHFGWKGASSFMLFFQKVQDSRLKAVTHDDESARVQTVTDSQNPVMYQLLRAFKKVSGVGVLCNTSLNFPGCGFINRKSDLFEYLAQTNITCAVIAHRMYTIKALAI